jgi:hypothetical protein
VVAARHGAICGAFRRLSERRGAGGDFRKTDQADVENLFLDVENLFLDVKGDAAVFASCLIGQSRKCALAAGQLSGGTCTEPMTTTGVTLPILF